MRTSPRPDPRLRRALVGLATAVLGALTAYLLLDRNHAEELGGGLRAVTDVLRGERPVSPITWVVLAALATALVVRSTVRRVPARARR